MRRGILVLGVMVPLVAPLPAVAAYQECRGPSNDGQSTLTYSHGARSCQAGQVMICNDGTWQPVSGESCGG